MEQVHFRGKIHVICKGAERVDGGMDEDAGEQAAATIKDCDQQETDCDCKDDLAQVIDQIHTATVEQVDDMSDTKSHTGDNNGGFDIILCNGLKQKPPEDHFLQESDAEHTHNTTNLSRRRVIDGNTVPEISRCQDKKRHIVEEPAGRDKRFAKPIPCQQVILSNKGKKYDCLQDAELSACRVFDSNHFVQWICQRLQNAVNHDPYNRKGQPVFLL